MAVEKIAVLGVGLIGGSLGLAAREYLPGTVVYGNSRSRETMEKALTKGAISQACKDKGEAVKDADLVFICTPVNTITDIVREIVPYLKNGAIVTDVGSTKKQIVSVCEALMPEGTYFIGGHPLAGSEREGVEAASPSLFKNAFYVLTPTERTDPVVFQKVHGFLNNLGANVIAVEPEKHDLIMAYISHLPHLLAFSLVNLASVKVEDIEDMLRFTAGGFRDMTRIAAGSPSIWVDIFLSNKEALKGVIEEYIKLLNQMKEAIDNNDTETLNGFISRAREARLNLPIRKDKDLKLMRDLLVPVTDRPGVLSEVTVAIGRLGINIEDIGIIHGEGQGLIKVTVSGEENSEKALRELERLGFKTRVKKSFDEE